MTVGEAPKASPSEAELLQAVASGDQQALARLYDRLSPVVLGLARRMLGQGPEADEVCLEVFTQVWRQADRFDARRGSGSAWVLVIARTRALDALRARQREANRVAAMEAEAAAMPEPEWSDPQDEVLVKERQSQVRRALGTLPDLQRQALELAYFDGLSQSEIAEATGWPLGTVKTRVRQALLRLREHLSGTEVRP